MLSRTFVFLPGIGPVRELALWRRGIHSWSDYRKHARIPGIRPHVKSRHDAVLEIAESSYPRDPSFFARLLPPAEHWRAYGTFGKDAAYVDIETTGDRANLITVVGVRRMGQSRAFVRGQDYTPEAVSDFLRGATSLVSFNGASFDLPVLANEGVEIPPVPHVDLRVVFSRIGYTGGLKKIEETLGMTRGGAVRGLSGYDAVKLWRRWEQRGDEEALRTLVAYNVADFENLEPLARFACQRLEEQLIRDAMDGQARLPEPALEASVPADP